MTSKSRVATAFGVSLIALCAASAAAAQAVPDSATPAAQPDIVVTGQRASQERAIEVKREAIGVVDVASADEIGRLPDRNVSEVIEHLPGVGVTYDQGEGRYVAVRGVPSNLNGYTVDGIEIGNPDATTRSLPLDIISGQLLSRVEIAKVKTADMDAQGIGGSINLVTQTAFDYRKAFNVAASFKAGYQQLNHKVPIEADGSIAARFGSDEQFGIVLGASYSNRDFVSEGFYPDDWRPVAGAARGGMPTNIKFTEYSLDRKRIGATTSLDWRPSDRQSFYVRGIYSKFIEDEIRPRYRLDFATDAIVESPDFHLDSNGLTGTVTGDAAERRQDLRLDYKAKEIIAGIVGGSTTVGDLKLDYVGARIHNKLLDKYPLWQFRCRPGTVDFDFSNPIYTAAPETECGDDDMQFRQYSYLHKAGTEGIWQGKLDAKYDLDGDNFLKAGFKYRTSDIDYDANNDVWTRGATADTRFTLGQFGLGAPGVLVHPDDTSPGRAYFDGPLIDSKAIQAFTDENLPGKYFVYDPATSLSNDTLADFALKEQVTAAYAMANFTFGAVTVTPGVRWEHTHISVTGFQLQNDSTVVPASRTNSYDDFLPTLLVKIHPADDVIFRLAYSRSLGRPEYSDLSPGGSIVTEDGSTPGTLDADISLGNPDLKPYRSDNLDATAEWYFAEGGLLSVGVFAKIIKNPIFTQSFTEQNSEFNGVPYELISFSQPLNADRGDIVGIEAQYQQQFTFLPGLLSGLGIQLNATFTDSTLRLPSGRTSTFPSQSRYLYGAELFYQKGPVEASIAYHNTGYQLLSTGNFKYQDQYNDSLHRLDAKASVDLLESVKLFFEAQNLTDEPTRQYQGGHKDWVIQNERYGRTYYAGVSVRF